MHLPIKLKLKLYSYERGIIMSNSTANYATPADLRAAYEAGLNGNSARAYAKRMTLQAVTEGDLAAAQSWQNCLPDSDARGTTTATRAPEDYVAAMASRVAALRAVASAIVRGDLIPTDLPEDMADAYRAALADADVRHAEVPDSLRAGIEATMTRSVFRETGTHGRVPAHFAALVESGQVVPGQVYSFTELGRMATEFYPEPTPSQMTGRLSAPFRKLDDNSMSQARGMAGWHFVPATGDSPAGVVYNA